MADDECLRSVRQPMAVLDLEGRTLHPVGFQPCKWEINENQEATGSISTAMEYGLV
jgi:hypothetical protein